VEFTLAHSSKSVAIPEALSHATVTAGSVEDLKSGEANQPRYFCPKCLVFLQESEVKRVGLVGHAKRLLCPKCSTLVNEEAAPQKPEPGRKGALKGLVKLKW
jgi:hypothetical protein